MIIKRLSVSRLLLLVTTVVVVDGIKKNTTSTGTKCTLTCSNHGRCIVGNESFVELDPNLDVPFFHQANAKGQYCLCNKGWTGIDCDSVYESCGVNGAGCLNGGNCVEGLVDDFGNPQFLCDCTNATDDNGGLFVGKYCEHPTTKYCDDNKDTFCVNGADCDPSYPLTALPCICDKGYSGFHCEFASDQVPNCTLDCLNEGQCVVGILSPDQADGRYNFQGDDDQQFQRCECPANYEGLYCEIQKEPCGEEFCYFGGTCKHDNKTCDCTTSNDGGSYHGQYCQFKTTEDFVGDTENTTQQVPCGRNEYCFNGGLCSVSMVDGEIEHHCDCSTADKDGLSYVGQYCQYLSTDCGDDCQKDPDTTSCGDQFCFNGATCEPSTSSSKHYCKCAKGFAGTFCEYKAINCSLDCQNGGICVQGGLTDADADDTFNSWNASVSYDHCLCADGYDGVQCELKQEVCDNGQKCYNGGTCVKTTMGGESRYHCDCAPTITDTTAFAGRFCQYEASEICSRDANNNALLFCVNGGACIGDGYEGCACPSNYTGFSCEFVKAIAGGTSTGEGNTTTATGGSSTGEGTTTDGGSSTGQGTTTTSNGGSSTGEGATTTTSSNPSKGNSQIDLCTTGNIPPGQPRFFCINGGSCKAYVPGGQPHPGCNCVSGWEGPHCEMSSNNDDSTKKGLVAIKVLLALVTIVLIGMVGYCAYKRMSVQRRRFTPEERRRLKDEVNIAPHRESFTDFSFKNKSSSDPIASAAASLPGAPEVYIGPPRDEDGHELHNVEII